MRILNSRIHPITNHEATQLIIAWAAAGDKRYVCAANVHMVMEAYDSTDFKDVVNSADLVTPDGMPLVWVMRLRGYKQQERVYGPTLMLKILQAAENENIPVGFLGGQPGVLNKLVAKMIKVYPSLKIVCEISPPFDTMTTKENESIVKEIQLSEAKILFVGLGCPKQEYWMHAHLDQLNTVMLGVGAAFDFHAGSIKQAPIWIQNLGLEWLFRLSQEPVRLWKRYLILNPRFIALSIVEQIKYWFR